MTLLNLPQLNIHLLVLLAKNEGRVLTHQYILREIWGIGYIEPNTIFKGLCCSIAQKN